MTAPSPTDWPSHRHTVLVLPFVPTDGEDRAYLAEGVSDELVLALSQLAQLSVVARGTAAALRNERIAPEALAALVGATVVVTGQVMPIDGRFRIESTITLVREPANSWIENAWAEPGTFCSVIAHLAQRIALFCDVAVSDAWRVRVSRPHTEHAEAFDLFLRGRYHSEQRPIGVKLAMQCFDRAIGLEGEVAAAFGALALLWANFGIFLALPPHQARERAREQALRALALDDGEPNARSTLLTNATFYDWDLSLADALGESLMASHPSYVPPRQVLLYAHAARGHTAEVRSLGRDVQRLDPWSVDPVNDYGFALLLTGQAREAVAVLESHVALHPEASEVHRRLGLAWLDAGDAHKAVTHLTRSVALSRRHAWGVANLACARAAASDDAGARALLAELVERGDGELVPAAAMAEIHTSLGAIDDAFAALERALASRDYWLLAIDRDPLLAPLRGDPRFAPFRARCVAAHP